MDAHTFISTTYERRGESIIRITETIADRFVFPDGSFLPQTVVQSRESEVKSTDADYADAVDWVDTIAAEEYLRENEF